MLGLIQSLKNSFAPVNRIHPEILSLIPNHWEDSHRDENLIQATHVCRSWRNIFISCPSLWAHLDFANIDKTRIYLERSRSVSLDICFEVGSTFYRKEAFLLAVPRIPRLKALSVSGDQTKLLSFLVKHFSCDVPLLEELRIHFYADQVPALPDKIFNGGLSSLRKLDLAGVIMPMSWMDLSNLTTFNLCDVPEDTIFLSQLLDFFESFPLLRHIHLHDSIPGSGGVPAERVVSLSHLEDLSITTKSKGSVLLNHLFIPAGASLRLQFNFSVDLYHIPTPNWFPKSPDRLGNLSHITVVNFCFGVRRRCIRLNGPSGEFYVIENQIFKYKQPHAVTSQFIRTIDQYDISRARWLAITVSDHDPICHGQITERTAYHILHRMKNLRTLMLIKSENFPFVHSLSPNFKTVLCPKLEELILYIEDQRQLYLNELLRMAEERDLRGAKLSAITIVSTKILAPMKEVFQLRKHVLRVEYKIDDAPEWDTLPS